MVRSYANFGRPMPSNAGTFPVVAYSRTVPRNTYGFGGQPGMLITGLSLMMVTTPTAPVGLGPLDCRPPHEEQEPMEMTAAAREVTSLSMSIPFLPAIFR